VRRPTRSRSKSHLLLERHDDNRSAAGGATNRQPQQPASNSTSCGGGGGGNRQANSTTTTTTTTTADIGRNQMGHDRERNAANQKMIGGGATGSNHVLVDLDASSPMDTPPPSPPLPPLPPQSGGRDDTPTSATAAGGGDDMSTYVREMWPMAPPPVPMMMGGGNSMITSFPLPPPPLLPPESTMSPELSDSSTQHRKKRTLSTGAGVVGRQPIQTTTVTLVNTGPALPPRPASAYVGGTMQASSGEYVSLASNTNGTQTWNPRAMNVRPIAVPASAGGGSASHHSNVVGGSRTGGGCTSKAYDNDYDSTHIHETPLYVRREQMANATSTAMAGSAATMSAAGGSIHGRRSIGGGMSMGKNSDRQNKHQQQQQRYFEMIPNGCDSTDYDNEDDDDDDDDNDDDLRGGYDSIAAVTARCRSKSLPRNVAVLSSSAASSANAAAYGANRYH
jgi:hypothetical protein